MPEQRVMLITGTSQSLGKYLARLYLEKGYTVIGCSRSNVDFGMSKYQHYCLDICNSLSVKQLFIEIRKNYKNLDILINNAALFLKNLVLMTSDTAITETMDTNTKGTIIFSREACKLMSRGKFGRIINISSVIVNLRDNGGAVYAASKAAVEHFGSKLAREVYNQNITVNTLSLSLIADSGMLDHIDQKIMDSIIEKTISKKFITMEEVAHVIDFLIDKKSGNITGQTICVGGV